MKATFVVKKLQSGSYVDVDTLTDTRFLPNGGTFMFAELFSSALDAGTYHVKLTVIGYMGGNGTTPPTESELASWPANQQGTLSQENSDYGCGTGGPSITSTPP